MAKQYINYNSLKFIKIFLKKVEIIEFIYPFHKSRNSRIHISVTETHIFLEKSI